MADLLLRNFSTMKIGGKAERILFYSEFLSGLKNGENFPKPFRILGNGSNTLIDDEPLEGTVIISRLKTFEEPVLVAEDENSRTVKASAGVFLPGLSKWAANQGLSGCEYMVGVPGTLGGAVVQNAGANDQEIKDILVEIEAIHSETRETKIFRNEDLDLSYRTSAFKNKIKDWWVSSATLKLAKSSREKIEAQTEKNLEYRKLKTPYSKPSLGSIYTRLTKTEGFPGELIEKAGLKGRRIGDAVVSEVHANYIVNEGKARFDEVLNLMKEIEAKVFEKSGVQLKREVLIWSDRNQ